MECVRNWSRESPRLRSDWRIQIAAACVDRISESSTFPAIIDFCFAFDSIAIKEDFAGVLFNTDTDDLLLCVGWAGVANDVVFENEVFRLAAHANTRGVAFGPVVLDQIIFQPIAMAGHANRLVAEEHTLLVIRAHLV